MNLLVNFLQSRSGGGRAYLRNILPYIDEWSATYNITIHVLLYREQICDDKIDISNIKFHLILIDKISRFKFLTEQLIVRKVIQRVGADILFTPYQVAIPFYRVKSVSMLRNMEVFLHWGYSYALKMRIRNIILQAASVYSLKKSDLIVAVSEFSRNFMIDNLGISEKKIIRIYHGRDERFNSAYMDKDIELLRAIGVSREEYIFTSGSILPYRKLEIVLEAFARSKISCDIKLVVAGDGNDLGYKKKIYEVVEQNKLKGRVIFLGFIDIESVAIIYRNCKFFVTATEIEACPNIAIEAMSSRCVVLAPNKAPLPEMFGDVAVYFQPGNVEDLAAKMNSLVFADKKEVDYNLERFSWKQCAEDTIQSIMSIAFSEKD